MANITNNRIDTILNDGQIASAKSLLEQMNTVMPFLLGLTRDERSNLPKISVANKVFTEDAWAILHNNPGLFPSFINATKLLNDLTLYRQLDELATISRQLTEKLEDTTMLAGSEAYVTALAVYRLLGSAADAGIAGADVLYEQLKARFAGQGGAGTANTNTDTTPTV